MSNLRAILVSITMLFATVASAANLPATNALTDALAKYDFFPKEGEIVTPVPAMYRVIDLPEAAPIPLARPAQYSSVDAILLEIDQQEAACDIDCQRANEILDAMEAGLITKVVLAGNECAMYLSSFGDLCQPDNGSVDSGPSVNVLLTRHFKEIQVPLK